MLQGVGQVVAGCMVAAWQLYGGRMMVAWCLHDGRMVAVWWSHGACITLHGAYITLHGAELRKFCLESTIWHNVKPTFVGAYWDKAPPHISHSPHSPHMPHRSKALPKDSGTRPCQGVWGYSWRHMLWAVSLYCHRPECTHHTALPCPSCPPPYYRPDRAWALGPNK